MPNKDKKFHLRREEKEISDVKAIEQIIKKAKVCCLGLVDNEEPYVVPINFDYGNNAIYFHSALEGYKVDLIKKNNKVCFAIYTDMEIGKFDSSNCAVKYRSVIGRGKVHIVEDNEEKISGLKAIMRQCAGGEYSFSEDRLNPVLVARIDIESMTGKQSGY